MKTLQTLLILTLFSVLLEACLTAEADNKITKISEPIPVKIMSIEAEETSQPIYSSGQFFTDDETFLSFKTGGIVSSVLVKEGDKISKGQLLAKLDLTEISAQVSQAQLGFEKAQRDFNRAENLYKDSVATLEQYQNAKTGLEIAKQQLNAAIFNLNYSEIRAVTDGFVLKKFVNPGQLVSSGSPIFQTNGGRNSAWILKTGLSDKEWAKIKIGDRAIIVTDANPDQKIEAVVRNKSESADPLTGSFSVELKITDSKNAILASGLFGKVTLTPSAKNKTWAIPYESLLDGNANSGFVFVTSDEKIAHKIPVKISSVDKQVVRIESGLENQHKLIVSGSAYLSDESPISVVH